jgi:hypothetical protein
VHEHEGTRDAAALIIGARGGISASRTRADGQSVSRG